MNGLKNLEISGLRNFLRTIEFVRVIAPEMPIQFLAGLLAIARRDLEGNPMSVNELVSEIGASSASATRIAGYLGDDDYRGREGLKMIIKSGGGTDGRTKYLHLTPKGRAFMSSLLRMNGHSEQD